MGFSLIGLLVGVFLVVWLGSKVMDSTDGTTTKKETAEDVASTIVAANTTLPKGIEVKVDPSTGLADGATVTITSSAFPAGSPVKVAECASGSNIVTQGSDPCDQDHAATATVGADGKLSTTFRVGRAVTIGGTPFDCASQDGYCSVRVISVSDPKLAGAVPISFAPDPNDRGPEITLPD